MTSFGEVIRAESTAGQVKTALTAVKVTIKLATGINVTDLLSSLVTDYVKANVRQAALKPATILPEHGFDPAEIMRFLVAWPVNSELELSDLIDKITVLMLSTLGARTQDVACTPTGCLSPGRDLSTAVDIVVRYYNSKTGFSAAGVDRKMWSSPFSVEALRPAIIAELKGLGPDAACEMCDKLSLISALAEYDSRMQQAYTARGMSSFRLGGRKVSAAQMLVHVRTKLSSTQPLQFLSSQRLSNRIKMLHSRIFGQEIGRGKDMEVHHYRHVASGIMRAVGVADSQRARLTQSAPDKMFARYYNKLPPNPSYMARWYKVSEGLRQRMNTDERFLI